MKKLFFLLLFLAGCFAAVAGPEKPLRIFIRAGAKTHGPGQHDSPRFLKEWTALLNERGAQATGAMAFPTAKQLADADVLVLYAQNAGDISPQDRVNLDKFLKRGGGIVAIHDAVASHDPQWFKTIIGGSWEYGRSKFFEGDLAFYYLDHTHPITRDVSNFDFDDEMYWDLDLMPEARVLAGTYQPDERNKHNGVIMPSVYDVAPQMWTYEKDNYRAFVSIPGHNYKTFNLPHFRAVLLRGIAWAGKRDADLLVSKAELATLRYPAGGPTPPEEAAKKIYVAPGFNLSLVASEPLIEKPISLDWDAKGRLWIAETPEYPWHHSKEPPRDRISILESSRKDGRMDKKTVFYEGLNLVTSLVFYKDGVIVAQAPEIIWLRDTKGKGKADTRTVLYKGFGNFDTHAVLSNLRWGMDGWIYATLGYSKGDIYSGDGATHFGRVSEGVIRFKPDGTAMEQVSSKGGNTWGVDFAPDGEIFFSQANGNHINHVVMPESSLARGRVGNTTSYKTIEDHNKSYPMMSWTKQAYVQIDWVGNFTAAAGACIYDGGAWPDKYNYTYYVSEPTINIVHQDILTPKGSTYVASKDPQRLEQEFVESSDLWFRPIHQRVGPDGALYILDFYNQAAVHNDTRGPKHDPQGNAAIRPDRDHYFGRIWRVQHKEAKKLEIPNLSRASSRQLVKALEHPNEWVRMTALRLLIEQGKTNVIPELQKLYESEKASGYARVHALWAMHDLSEQKPVLFASCLERAINSTNAVIKKNALRMVDSKLLSGQEGQDRANLRHAIVQDAFHPQPRVRLEALMALSRADARTDSSETQNLLHMYPVVDDDPWLESAFLGVAGENPLAFITEMFATTDDPGYYMDIAARLSAELSNQADAHSAAEIVILMSSRPARYDALKRVLLESIGQESKSAPVPASSPALVAALHNLLASTNAQLAMLTLPIASRWDQTGALTSDIDALVQKLAAKVDDASQPDAERAQVARTLLTARPQSQEIIGSVAKILGSPASASLQKQVIEILGGTPGGRAGELLTDAYPKLTSDLQDAVLNQLFKRTDWSMGLLNAIEARKVDLTTLGPVAINRLRTHSNPDVAARANKIIDALRGPEMKEKDALIAKFTPIVVQPGDPVRGHEMFVKNCEVCHRFKGEGKDVAPDLTGMGAHGPAELIIHVLDPNREVEPNYYAYSIETKDGEIYDGVIARENSASLTLRNAAGDTEIPVRNIKSRRNTGLSLMPNGFESLGAETLRDIFTYLCEGEANFRIIDLQKAYTASTLKGLWLTEDDPHDTLAFKKFGVVNVGGVPFEIMSPLKSPNGKNVIVLRGGVGAAKTRPQRVEIMNVNAKAARLHFLGGVAGWGYPLNNGTKDVAKVTVHYADGQSEELTLQNGVEIADWNGATDVPGSKSARALVKYGQVRWFTKNLRHPGMISSLTLESFDTGVSPTFVAITADSSSAPLEVKEAAVAPKEFKWAPGTTHVLILGGGSSHDFNRWFNEADSATLAVPGKISVNYTDNPADLPSALKDVDVLYECSNQTIPEAARKAIFDFANAGHGLLLVHPALWYNWQDWPEYNRVLVGGGTLAHNKYGEFQVAVKTAGNPVMAGVPATFNITDELYHSTIDPKGTPVEVLAEARDLATGKTYPSVWIVKHPKARIVCIALGHDAKAHELDAYKTILRNALNWASGH